MLSRCGSRWPRTLSSRGAGERGCGAGGQSWADICKAEGQWHVCNVPSITPVTCHPIGGLGITSTAAGRKAKRGQSRYLRGQPQWGAGAKGTVLCRQRVWRGREVGWSGREGQARLPLQVYWDGPRSRQAALLGRPWGSRTAVIATGSGMAREDRDRGRHPGTHRRSPV